MAFPPEWEVVKLNQDSTIAGFDCGDSDLNDFLLNDAKPHSAELLSTTFLVLDDQKNVAAFYSLFNDQIRWEQSRSKSFWKKHFQRQISYPKRRPSYPSVKLGRLGVSSKHQSQGIGLTIMDYLKVSFTFDNKTGCRFITVDAYNNPRTLKFYKEKCDFDYLTNADVDPVTGTHLMFFDLYQLVK